MVLEGKTTCFERHNPTIWYSTTYGLTATWVQNQQNGYKQTTATTHLHVVAVAIIIQNIIRMITNTNAFIQFGYYT